MLKLPNFISYTIATLSMSSELPLVIVTDLHIESETLLLFDK